MRFIVCGAGAIGGVIAAQLAKAGYKVVVIDRLVDHVDAINRHGLHLRGINGNHVLPLRAVASAAEVGFRPSDVVFLSVKSFHSDAACRELREATTLELPIFCAQNGLRNEEVASRSFTHVHGVMVYIGAKRLKPGIVVDTGPGIIGVGSFPRGLTGIDHAVHQALLRTDFQPYVSDEIMRHKWNKLITNLGNATLGLTGFSTHEFMADPECRRWMADLYEEGARMLAAAGIEYECPTGLTPIDEQIERLRNRNYKVAVPDTEELKGRSSLWQDLAHGTGQIEAHSFNGEIIRLGLRHGVPTPYNTLSLRLITQMAKAHEQPGKYTIPELHSLLAVQGANAAIALEAYPSG